jgi:hypothetical protein
MSIDVEVASYEKVRSDRMITVLVILCAVLIGSSTGFLVANRDGLPSPEASTVAPAPATAKIAAPASPVTPKPMPAVTIAVTSVAAKSDPATSEVMAPPVQTLTSLASSLGSIRYSEGAGSADVDIELGTTVLLRADRLHDPERVYFDLRDEGSTAASRANGAAEVTGDYLTGIRTSARRSGSLRIVLDCKKPCDYSYKIVPEPSPRLIVTLR